MGTFANLIGTGIFGPVAMVADCSAGLVGLFDGVVVSDTEVTTVAGEPITFARLKGASSDR